MKSTVRVARLDNKVVLNRRAALLSALLLSLIIVLLVGKGSGILV